MAPSHGSLELTTRLVNHMFVLVDSIDFKVLKAYYAVLCDRRSTCTDSTSRRYNEYQITQVELLIQYKRWRNAARKDYHNDHNKR